MPLNRYYDFLWIIKVGYVLKIKVHSSDSYLKIKWQVFTFTRILDEQFRFS